MCLWDWMGWDLLWVHYDNDNWQFRASNYGIYDCDISNKELRVSEQWTSLLNFAMFFKWEKSIFSFYQEWRATATLSLISAERKHISEETNISISLKFWSISPPKYWIPSNLWMVSQDFFPSIPVVRKQESFKIEQSSKPMPFSHSKFHHTHQPESATCYFVSRWWKDDHQECQTDVAT